jgi:hypothetical protein
MLALLFKTKVKEEKPKGSTYDTKRKEKKKDKKDAQPFKLLTNKQQ